MDMHADDQLCWRYTAIMVVVQLLAFGRIQDNRVQIKAKRAAKLDKEKKFKEKVAMEEERRAQMKIGQVDGACDFFEDADRCVSPCTHGRATNGSAKSINGKPMANGVVESETSEELTETSEEELFI
jgi:Icc-related predicted phosphoesterase